MNPTRHNYHVAQTPIRLIGLLLFACFVCAGIALFIVRGSGDYVWIQSEQQIGIMRTDTGQTIFLPGFQANITAQRHILDSDGAPDIQVTFYDQTTRPGRVTLQFQDSIIDVMEKGITYNNTDIPWK